MKRIKSQDTNNAQEKIRQQEHEYIALAVGRYDEMYMLRFGRHPLPTYLISNLKRRQVGKHSKTFKNIVSFVFEERRMHDAQNTLYALLTDYYNCVFNHYKRFNRRPTINQISASPTNTSSFIEFAEREENEFGGYWLTKEQIQQAKTGGTKYIDPLIKEALEKI